MTNENEAFKYTRNGTLGTYDLLDALYHNPLLIRAGADICKEAAETIKAKDARIEELEAQLHIYEGRNGQPVSSTGVVDEMADALKQKDKRIAELEAKMANAMELLVEYRTKTPLGHQPHMIAHRADDIIAEIQGNP